MKSSISKSSARRLSLALAVSCLFTVGAAQAGGSRWDALRMVPEDQLDRLRGGFDFGAGVYASFGVTREVLVNGEVVATTRLLISNLSNLFVGRMPTIEVLGNALTLVQNGAGNFAASPARAIEPVAVAPSPVAAIPVAPPSVTPSVSVSAPVAMQVPSMSAPAIVASQVASPSVNTPTSVASPIPTPSTNLPAVVASQPAAPSVILSGPTLSIPLSGPTVVNSALSLRESIALGVQNTINNQIIQTRTTIDATIASMNALRTQLQSSAFRDQISGARSR